MEANIAAWIVQRYGKNPAVLNVSVKVLPFPIVAELQSPESLVVLWLCTPVHVHFTWSPVKSVTLAGEKKSSPALTLYTVPAVVVRAWPKKQQVKLSRSNRWSQGVTDIFFQTY